MLKVPGYISDAAHFGDDTPRRRIVVSTYLTKAENDAMVAGAQAARMTQKEYLKRCLDAGFQDSVTNNKQTRGATS